MKETYVRIAYGKLRGVHADGLGRPRPTRGSSGLRRAVCARQACDLPLGREGVLG